MSIKTFLYLWEKLVLKLSLGSFEVVEVKFGYSEKATKFLSGRFFQILWPSQNILTLKIGQ